MSGQDLVEVIGVLIVAFVLGVIVPLTITFLFVKHRGGAAELYQTAAAVRAGKVEDLLQWDSSSLSDLTSECLGWSTYTASMFGRNDQVAGLVPSSKTEKGWLLGFCADAKREGSDGKVVAVTSAHKLELSMAGGTFSAMVNGAPLGSIKLGDAGEATLVAPDGAQVGSYRRQVSGGQLVLNGKEMGTLARTTAITEGTPMKTPLIASLPTGRSTQEEAWILALAVVQFAWVGPGVGSKIV